MDEYINREATSEELRKYYYKNPPNSSYEEGFDRGLDRAQRVILDAPASDVAPVRHGRWLDSKHKIFSNTYDYVCSNCGCDYALAKYNYCPHCGAKMDGGDSDETN